MPDALQVLEELDRLIAGAAPKDRPALIVALSARLAGLGARLAEVSPIGADETPGPTEEEARFLTPEEAAAIATVSVRWLLRHTRGQRFRKDLSRKRARFEERSFRRWLDGRNTNSKKTG